MAGFFEFKRFGRLNFSLRVGRVFLSAFKTRSVPENRFVDFFYWPHSSLSVWVGQAMLGARILHRQKCVCDECETATVWNSVIDSITEKACEPQSALAC